MLKLAGFQITEQLHEGAKTIVYRGLRLSDKQPVILKILKKNYPTLEEIATLEYEYQLLKNLNIPGTTEVYDLVRYQNRLVLTLKDVNGETLDRLIQQGPLPLDKFFVIALSLVNSIQHLHKHHLIHKDIKPANIIISREDNNIYLIDFSIASVLLDHVSFNSNINRLEGTLAYMSPEQTGRMNISLDQRTDLYSLGVVFYEMLTGQRPFTNEDPLELVYAHLAKYPVPLHAIDEKIPVQLSNIILKLLAKDPNQRYNSAEGLKQDMNECAMQWFEFKRISPFQLGQLDDQSELKISNQLYGRHQQSEELLSAFSEITQPKHKSACVLVSGSAGVGKSVLVQTLQQPIMFKHGYLVSGKFEQLQKNIPYYGLIQALQALIKQLITQPEESLVHLKARVKESVGNLGRIIIDIIPEAQWLLGEQPSVPVLSPVETRNRFELAFQNFIQALIEPDKPLVMFLDDLQWADHASFKFLEFILIDAEIKNLMIIGTYRHNERNENIGLKAFIKRIKEHNVSLHEIELHPLSVDDIDQLLQDSLYLGSKEVHPLAKLLHEKTGGNPFFVKKYLQKLHQENVLVYDLAKLNWQWNMDAIKRLSIAGNVVTLITNKIYQLSSDVQTILAVAACIGNKFTLQMIAQMTGKSFQEISTSLIEAIQVGLIMPLDQAYKYVELFATTTLKIDKEMSGSHAAFEFVHDRVQQAAYKVMPENERIQTHVKLGRLLLKKYLLKHHNEYLFETLNHLNKGLKLLETPEERFQVAEYNLLAGQRAKAANASFAAIDYLDAGIRLLGKQGWTTHYDLMFSLYKEVSQCKYFCLRFVEAEHDFQLILQKAKTPMDKAIILDMQADLYSNLGKYQDAVKTLMQGLNLLGINLTPKFPRLHIYWEIFKLKFKLRGNKIEQLSKRIKKLEDPKDILITTLFNHLIYPAYSSDENIFLLSICKSVSFCLKKGYSMHSLENLLNFVIILESGLKSYDQGLALTKLTQKLDKEFDDRKIHARNEVTFAVFINHWHYPLRNILKLMQETLSTNKEVGDLHYAAGTTGVYSIYQFETGENIAEVLEEVNQSQVFLKKVKSDYVFFNQTMKHILEFLQDKFKSIDKIMYDLEKMKKIENDSAYFVAQSYCVMLLYFTGDYTLAFQQAQEAKRHISAAIGTFPYVSFYFYYGLVLIKLIEANAKKNSVQYWKEVNFIANKLEEFAKQCPENFAHLSHLLAAEIYRLKKQPGKAGVSYDKAIEAAYKNGFFQYVAIANECAANFYDNVQRDTIAQAYFQAAHYAYVRWGAIQKSKSLEEQFPHLKPIENYPTPLLSQGNYASITSNVNTSHMSSSDSTAALDLFSILKANRAISSELTLSNVLKKLIEIVLENSGAHRAALINVREKNFVIEAEGSLENNNIQVTIENSLLMTRNDYPNQVINYVANSKERVRFGDMANHDLFKNDPYVARTNLKSILCIPLFHKNKMSYILYLENNLLSNFFTMEHAEIITALGAQAAISLENAHLYAAYEQFVPYQFLEQLNKLSITDVRLGDQVERTMTVLFCDIRGFSSLSESMTPAEVFDFINQFLSIMEPVVRQNQGFIDKYIGDAIMALFINADSALQTALSMFKKLNEFNERLAGKKQKIIDIGIGIDTGKVMLGIIGSKNRIETSVLSDTVNNASNIQQLTRQYNVRILLSLETRNALSHPENFSMQMVAETRIKNKAHPIEVWELLDKTH